MQSQRQNRSFAEKGIAGGDGSKRSKPQNIPQIIKRTKITSEKVVLPLGVLMTPPPEKCPETSLNVGPKNRDFRVGAHILQSTDSQRRSAEGLVHRQTPSELVGVDHLNSPPPGVCAPTNTYDRIWHTRFHVLLPLRASRISRSPWLRFGSQYLGTRLVIPILLERAEGMSQRRQREF